MENNSEETFTFYRLLHQHHKHLKSTNMLERLKEEIKRRTLVVRIFPHAESCLRLIRALAGCGKTPLGERAYHLRQRFQTDLTLSVTNS